MRILAYCYSEVLSGIIYITNVSKNSHLTAHTHVLFLYRTCPEKITYTIGCGLD